jgi:hypothetical protein
VTGEEALLTQAGRCRIEAAAEDREDRGQRDDGPADEVARQQVGADRQDRQPGDRRDPDRVSNDECRATIVAATMTWKRAVVGRGLRTAAGGTRRAGSRPPARVIEQVAATNVGSGAAPDDDHRDRDAGQGQDLGPVRGYPMT